MRKLNIDRRLSRYLGVIRTVIPLLQPRRFRIWNFANFADDAAVNNALLALDHTDLKTLVLWPFENLISM
jgi:hypothetical protein